MSQSRQAMAESIKQEILTDLNNRNMPNYSREQFRDNRHYEYQAADRRMVESIKKDILAEMEAQREAMEDHYRHRSWGRKDTQMSGWNRFSGGSRLGQLDLERIKREILIDLHREMGEDQYPYSEYRVHHPLSRYEHTVVDSIKNDLLSEMEARRAARYAQMYGYGHLVSDRNLNHMIHRHYSTLQNIRGDLKKELEGLRDIENRIATIPDPHVRELAYSIVTEARQQGLTLDEVLNYINRQDTMGKVGWRQRISDILNYGNKKGFLYGAGAVILAAMLLPMTKRNLHEVAVRTVGEGMDLVDRTKNMFNWGKDGEDTMMEDNLNQYQQQLAEDKADIDKLEE